MEVVAVLLVATLPIAIAISAAASVVARVSSSCVMDTNAASNWLGGQYTPLVSIMACQTAKALRSQRSALGQSRTGVSVKNTVSMEPTRWITTLAPTFCATSASPSARAALCASSSS